MQRASCLLVHNLIGFIFTKLIPWCPGVAARLNTEEFNHNNVKECEYTKLHETQRGKILCISVSLDSLEHNIYTFLFSSECESVCVCKQTVLYTEQKCRILFLWSDIAIDDIWLFCRGMEM